MNSDRPLDSITIQELDDMIDCLEKGNDIKYDYEIEKIIKILKQVKTYKLGK